jgi:[ribosomal protein S5]-alanine N-acetyltransferase
MSHAARPSILTQRLRLCAPEPALADAVLDFFERNRVHLAPWDPPRDAAFYSLDVQRDKLKAAADAFAAGSGFAYWFRRHTDTSGRIVGQVHFSNVMRGPLQGAMLGYSLDGAEQGQGLMHEALVAGIDEMFSERVMLHRLQANVRPENLRSRALLARLGFDSEGLARHYLYIDGAWRHHLMTARINPRFGAAPGI